MSCFVGLEDDNLIALVLPCCPLALCLLLLSLLLVLLLLLLFLLLLVLLVMLLLAKLDVVGGPHHVSCVTHPAGQLTR